MLSHLIITKLEWHKVIYCSYKQRYDFESWHVSYIYFSKQSFGYNALQGIFEASIIWSLVSHMVTSNPD